ncbi:MAG: hypothetical protein U0795_15465 [Pirellulales bacterium]
MKSNWMARWSANGRVSSRKTAGRRGLRGAEYLERRSVLSVSSVAIVQQITGDYNNDNVADLDTTYRTTFYDSAGQRSSELVKVDYRSDGTIDFVPQEITYAPSGQVLRDVQRGDSQHVGKVDSYFENSYDAAGQPILSLSQQFNQQGNLVNEERTLRTYNSSGKLTATDQSSSQDTNGDGKIDFVVKWNSKFSTAGPLLTTTQTIDFNGDGKVDLVAMERKYTADGKLLYSADRGDGNRDGKLDYLQEVTREYSKAGVLTREISNSGSDRNGDGRMDLVTRDVKYQANGYYSSVYVTINYGADKKVDFVAEETTYTTNGEIQSTITRVDNNFDSKPDGLYQRVYNSSRLLTRSVDASDQNYDGVYEDYLEFVGTYNAQGQLVTADNIIRRYGRYYSTHQVDTYAANGSRLSSVLKIDYENNGTIDLVAHEEQYQDGRQILSIDRTDDNLDGIADRISRTDLTYVNGRLVRQLDTESSDYNYDGILDVFTTDTEYNEQGRVIKRVNTVDYQGDGDPESITTATTTYDDSGRVQHFLRVVDTDGDGVTDYIDSQQDYDDDGRLLLSITGNDYNGDGQVDSTTMTAIVYSPDGLPILSTTTNDSNGDGDPDQISEVANEYDSFGRNTRRINRSDTNGDGSWDRIDTTEIVYDDHGNVIQATQSVDSDGDGQPDRITETLSTYALAGYPLLTQTTRVDYDGDGEFDFTRREYVANEQGRVLLEIQRSDNNEDGVADSVSQTIQTVDAQGNLVKYESSYGSDANGDGQLDSLSVSIQTYNEFGQTSLITGIDQGADGTLDFISEETYFDLPSRAQQQTIRNDYNGDGIPEYVLTRKSNNDGYIVFDETAQDFDSDGQFDRIEGRTDTYESYMLVRSEFHLVIAGVLDSTLVAYERTLDDQGRTTLEVNRTDGDRDGVVDAINSTEYIYDDYFVSTISKQSWRLTADNELDTYVSIALYGADGQLAKQYVDYNGDGTSEDIVLVLQERTADGQLLSWINRSDQNYDGVPEYQSLAYYGPYGQLSEETIYDYDQDGNPEQHTKYENVFDANGRVTSSIYRDFVSGYIRTTTTQFGANGELLDQLMTIDNEGDGQLDFLQETINTYNSSGQMLKSIDRQDSNGDGTWEFGTIIAYAYNSDGGWQRIERSNDYDDDGTGDFVTSKTEWDLQGRLILQSSTPDDNHDGIADAIFKEQTTYDSNGNLIQYVSSQDYNGDGTAESYFAVTNQFVEIGDDVALGISLMQDVNGLDLAAKTKADLLKPLQSALVKLQDTNPRNDSSAVKDLESFIQSVKKLRDKNSISAVTAELLINKTRQMIAFT